MWTRDRDQTGKGKPPPSWSLVRLNTPVRPRPEAGKWTDLLVFTAFPFLSLFPGRRIVSAEPPLVLNQREADGLGTSEWSITRWMARCVCTNSSAITTPHPKQITQRRLPPSYLCTYVPT